MPAHDKKGDEGLFHGLLESAKELLFGPEQQEHAANPSIAPTGPSDLLGPTLQQNRGLQSSAVDTAAATAAKDLEGGGGLLGKIFGPSEKQAGHALKVLDGLPPEQQGEAVAKLSASQIQALVKNASIEDRERMLGLVKNTTDPEKKLELFGAYHKAHATLDAKRDHETDATMSPEERNERNRHRADAAAGTSAEVDDEVAFLKNKEGGFKAEDVDALLQRKTAELGVEMKHAVKLTNQTGLRNHQHDATDQVSRSLAPSHVHWSKEELDRLNYSLDQTPREHRKGLDEIRRQSHDGDDIGVGGFHQGKRITVLDEGANPKDIPFSSVGEPREGGDRSTTVNRLEHVVSHEAGHHAASQNDTAFQKYKNASWRNRIDLNGAKAATSEVLAPGALPDPNRDPNARVRDPHQYARSSPDEQFAEHYAKAVHKPDTVHADMVSGPQAATAKARTAVTDSQNAKAKDLASAHPTKTAAQWDAEIQKATDDHAQAKDVEEMRKKQFDVMRNDVFGTDKAQQASEARLSARGLDAKQMQAFQARAAAASTPEQLRRIEQEFQQTTPGMLPAPQPPPAVPKNKKRKTKSKRSTDKSKNRMKGRKKPGLNVHPPL